MRVSRSGFLAWRKRPPSRRARRDAELMELIKEIHEESLGTYGAPRVHVELREGRGIRVGRKRVARLMRLLGVQGVHRRREGRPQDPGAREPVYEDLVARDFTADAPNRLWVADLTQHRTKEGWLYLAAVLDVFDKRVVGWSMGERAQAELVVGAVEMAVRNRRPEPGLIHHSDRGSQYGSLLFGRRLESSGIVGSMGGKGDAYDNSMMESFFATLQTELLDRREWETIAELRTAIFHFIEVFYNRKRRHSSLGYLSPQEFANRYAQQKAAA